MIFELEGERVIQNIAAIIQAVVSIINIAFVAVIFVRDKLWKTAYAQKEKEEFWYRETVLNRGLDTLDACFTEIENILNRANVYNIKLSDENEQQIKELVMEVKRQVFILKRGVWDYTKLFDTTFSNKIKARMENLEDMITVGLQTCYLATEDTGLVVSELNNCRYGIVSDLYNFDMKKTK